MISFSEVTNQVHLIKDRILSDMVYEQDNTEEELAFSKHLYCTKIWFARISYSNKKRYLLALLDDVRSAYTLSLLLKSIWNCRPKDAIMSISEPKPLSSFDQVPMDHNRTAQPVTLLAQVMKNDRKWFLTLDYESQALMLSELLSVSGGPVLWNVLNRAQWIYDTYREQQLQDIMEYVVISDKMEKPMKPDEIKEPQQKRKSSSGSKNTRLETGNTQRELELHLANWNSTVKSLRDSLKMEEIQMCFKDGSKVKMWKVNRPKPEVTETVDIIQLLPASLSKRILSYLPFAQLGDYAKVNKYWAYLVDDLRAEISVRNKIHEEIEKMKALVFEHDMSLDQVLQREYKMYPTSSIGTSIAPSLKIKQQGQSSVRNSEKSTHYSFRHFICEQLNKPNRIQKPLKNMKELTERLETRGAADENLFQWCANVLKMIPATEEVKKESLDGILNMKNMHFPCPLMKQKLMIPLQQSLRKDPAATVKPKSKSNISNVTLTNIEKANTKRYSLWSKDFSSLDTEEKEGYEKYFHIKYACFDHLLEIVEPYWTKQDTCIRKSLTAEEGLAVILRYLATGKYIKDSNLIMSPPDIIS